MAQEINFDQAKELLDERIAQAQGILEDPEQINSLLQQIQGEITNLPDTFKGAMANVPLMVDMVKSYISKEYTDVSPKVIASLVAAFLYFVSNNDLIPDKIPLIGIADDLAVAAVAMKLCEPELNAFNAWREANNTYDLNA
ncbi:MAG: DUF1232 domain-containing protein [Atopobiaceae bacterium]|nr:DUF1232 domain-containing protein [Atopobiaceae bacterium]